jgi:hypothetical protein
MPIGSALEAHDERRPRPHLCRLRAERPRGPHLRDGRAGLTELYQKENTKILPGYYVDVDLQYELTDTAGFYVGGIYQGAGGYSQTVPSGTGTAYDTSKIDLATKRASRAA